MKLMDVIQDRKGGFRVQIMFRPPMEDMFETITSAARFENVIDANRYVEKINEAKKALKCYQTVLECLNLDLWFWSPSKASPCGQLQEPSKAQDTFYPTSDYAKQILTEYDMRN